MTNYLLSQAFSFLSIFLAILQAIIFANNDFSETQLVTLGVCTTGSFYVGFMLCKKRKIEKGYNNIIFVHPKYFGIQFSLACFALICTVAYSIAIENKSMSLIEYILILAYGSIFGANALYVINTKN